MHDHTPSESRQNLKKECRDVGIREYPVRAVDEQKITRTELIEDALVGRLQRLLDDVGATIVDFLARLGIDRHERRRKPMLLNRMIGKFGGVSGSDFDQTRWTPGHEESEYSAIASKAEKKSLFQ